MLALRERGERVDVLTAGPPHRGDLERLPLLAAGGRAALGRADWVSLKVDTVEEATWHRLNRPEPSLELGTVLDGMSEASRGGGESEGVEA